MWTCGAIPDSSLGSAKKAGILRSRLPELLENSILPFSLNRSTHKSKPFQKGTNTVKKDRLPLEEFATTGTIDKSELESLDDGARVKKWPGPVEMMPGNSYAVVYTSKEDENCRSAQKVMSPKTPREKSTRHFKVEDNEAMQSFELSNYWKKQKLSRSFQKSFGDGSRKKKKELDLSCNGGSSACGKIKEQLPFGSVPQSHPRYRPSGLLSAFLEQLQEPDQSPKPEHLKLDTGINHVDVNATAAAKRRHSIETGSPVAIQTDMHKAKRARRT